MGVTGTLSILPKCQKDILERKYKILNFYEMPSVYEKSKRVNMGVQVVQNQDYFA